MISYYASKKVDYFDSFKNIILYKKPKALKKIFSKKTFPDIYLYNVLDKDNILFFQNAKAIVVSSKRVFDSLKDQMHNKKIVQIYPFLTQKFEEFSKNDQKKEFYSKHNIEEFKKLIVFSDSDFRRGGVKEFIYMINALNYKHIKACIVGDNKSLDTIKIFLDRHQGKDKFLLLEQSYLLDVLKVSDVFISPTMKRTFNLEVLRAMLYKNVVFTSIENDIKEILDNYSLMHSYNDMTVTFKIDRVLQSQADLDMIGEQNSTIAKTLIQNSQKKLELLIDELDIG